jgi:hypothetical protein
METDSFHQGLLGKCAKIRLYHPCATIARIAEIAKESKVENLISAEKIPGASFSQFRRSLALLALLAILVKV